ncbi:histidinol-phosphatase [Shimia sp. R11_0]|uniref:histidinol-phosphatase n=1 Tax=Shimia sp. R11_0 TaxID=2821096 RepID=UPI001ADCE3D3|nr:histidinol-phosphatase [Shimia sp. R11_0]MBO9478113.1 histidinol-phosphatase [Shimia sp. R11_0]
MTHDRDALVAVADAMADAARSAILPHFRNRALTADNKLMGGFDPVTVADRAAEQAMRAVLQEQRPQDAILGEEFGNQPGTSGLTWVLDPIDGTRGFITGTPTWGVLIAVSDDNGPIYGVVDQPYIGERFRGGLGVAEAQGPMGATAFHTRQTAQLSEATLFSTFPEVGTEAERQAFERVSKNVKLTRYGMDCYAYALVAVGQVDLVIEAGLNAYDIQAPIAVIEAAGGLVTNWQGAPVHMGGQVVAAANAELHQQALELLNAG